MKKNILRITFLVIFAFVVSIGYAQEGNNSKKPEGTFLSIGIASAYNLYRINAESLPGVLTHLSSSYVGLSYQVMSVREDGFTFGLVGSTLFGIDYFAYIYPASFVVHSDISTDIFFATMLDVSLLLGYTKYVDKNQSVMFNIGVGPQGSIEILKLDRRLLIGTTAYQENGGEANFNVIRLGVGVLPQFLFDITGNNTVFLLLGTDLNFSFFHQHINTSPLFYGKDSSFEETQNNFSFTVVPKMEITIKVP